MENIKKVRELLKADEKEMLTMINAMQKFGIVTKEAEVKLKAIKKASDALKEIK